MNAVSLFQQCHAAGIHLEARGDRLHVDAPAGSVTPELRQALADQKADLFALHIIHTRLVALAVTLGIPRTVVDAIPVDELSATAEQAASWDGHLDGNGDSLAHSLLVFYLCGLADRATPDRNP